ncbi:MAG TPA: hypothetical protein VLA89_07855 [Gemmatimonadales bacterium]|nr:hypothetical protein [Gemmatimonadales bacterium]
MTLFPRWSVIVPTCRKEGFLDFLAAWDRLFQKHDVKLVVVCDTPRTDPEIAVTLRQKRYHTQALDWATLPEGVPRKTDMVRSAGIRWAWLLRTEFTLTLDDDVRPIEDPFTAYEAVFATGLPHSDYLNVGALTTYGGPMRGFPYKDRALAKVGLQYGGWDGVLDYDAPTQLQGVRDEEFFQRIVFPVPRGAPFTGCIMNACWRTELAPAMWQLPLVDGNYNRFGDIWAGLFAKRTLDHLGYVTAINGKATVRHQRASDPVTNLEREAPGVRPNERLWNGLRAEGKDLIATYRFVTDRAADYFASTTSVDYARRFTLARDAWLSLFTTHGMMPRRSTDGSTSRKPSSSITCVPALSANLEPGKVVPPASSVPPVMTAGV